jgi:hypothetical protein
MLGSVGLADRIPTVRPVGSLMALGLSWEEPGCVPHAIRLYSRWPLSLQGRDIPLRHDNQIKMQQGNFLKEELWCRQEGEGRT